MEAATLEVPDQAVVISLAVEALVAPAVELVEVADQLVEVAEVAAKEEAEKVTESEVHVNCMTLFFSRWWWSWQSWRWWRFW